MLFGLAAPCFAFAQTPGPSPVDAAGPGSFWTTALIVVFTAAFLIVLFFWLHGMGLVRKLPIRLLMIAAILSFYGLACVMPALKDPASQGTGSSVCSGFSGKPDGIFYGIDCLLMGWIPPFTISWSANLFLIVGMILFACGRFVGTTIFAVIATFLGMTTPALILMGMFTQLLSGYFVWQGSMIALIAFAQIENRCQRSRYLADNSLKAEISGTAGAGATEEIADSTTS